MAVSFKRRFFPKKGGQLLFWRSPYWLIILLGLVLLLIRFLSSFARRFAGAR